jgi:putative membrane protein
MGRALDADAMPRMTARVACVALALPASAPAFAHGAFAEPQPAWIALALVLTSGAYIAGVVRLWRAAPTRGIRPGQAAAFLLGSAALACALFGPLDAWSARSFAAHMLQHEMLMLVAAPLLVAGRPLAAWTWTLPRRLHRPLRRMLSSRVAGAGWRVVTRPLGATLLQLAVLFVWHVPRLFDAAASHAGLHALQHASFLAAALCFWWATGRSARHGAQRPAPAAAAAALASLFVTMLATGALGALLTFAPAPWYGVYAAASPPWPLTATEDQQLGGLLMWIPGGTFYLAGGLLCARTLLATASPHAGRGFAMDATR